MTLSPRLNTIIDLIPNCNTLADIGTDHGYITIAAIKSFKAINAIATDISQKSLSKCILLAKSVEISNVVECRVGNGLEVLNDNEAQVIVIAGMGGLLIDEILKNDCNKAHLAKQLILQPMNASEVLRKTLLESGYCINADKISIEGNRYYEIIRANYDGVIRLENDEFYYEISRKMIETNDIELSLFLEYKLNKANNILKEISLGISKNSLDMKSFFKNKIEKYNEVLKCLAK